MEEAEHDEIVRGLLRAFGALYLAKIIDVVAVAALGDAPTRIETVPDRVLDCPDGCEVAGPHLHSEKRGLVEI